MKLDDNDLRNLMAAILLGSTDNVKVIVDALGKVSAQPELKEPVIKQTQDRLIKVYAIVDLMLGQSKLPTD